MSYRVIDAHGDGDTATLDDKFWIVDEHDQILANCVTREIAEFLAEQLRLGDLFANAKVVTT